MHPPETSLVSGSGILLITDKVKGGGRNHERHSKVNISADQVDEIRDRDTSELHQEIRDLQNAAAGGDLTPEQRQRMAAILIVLHGRGN